MTLQYFLAGAFAGFALMAVTFSVGGFFTFGDPFEWVQHGGAWVWVAITAIVGGLVGHPFRKGDGA